MKRVFAIALFVAAIGYFAHVRGNQPLLDPASVSLSDLASRLDTAERPRSHSFPRERTGDHFEAVLQKIIRRGGPDAEQLLSDRVVRWASGLEAARQKLEALDPASDGWMTQYGVVRNCSENLELLTALRRVQKKPDPLRVEVMLTEDVEAWRRNHFALELLDRDNDARFSVTELGEALTKAKADLEAAKEQLDSISRENSPAAWKNQNDLVRECKKGVENLEFRIEIAREIEERAPRAAEIKIPANVPANTRCLPVFVVALKSSDAEKVPVHMKFGGDYRTGREARWRFEVKDMEGNVLPIRRQKAWMLGGVYTEGELEIGKTWKTALPLSSFVDIPKPGRYVVTVMYHNDVTIADVADAADLEELVIFRSEPFNLTVENGPRRRVESDRGDRLTAQNLIRRLPREGTVPIVYGEYDESFHDFIDPESEEGELLRMKMRAVPALLDALNDMNLSRHQKACVLSVLYTTTSERDFNPTDYSGALPSYHWRSSPSCYGSCSGCKITAAGQQALIDKWLEFRNEYLDIREAEDR